MVKLTVRKTSLTGRRALETGPSSEPSKRPNNNPLQPAKKGRRTVKPKLLGSSRVQHPVSSLRFVDLYPLAHQKKEFEKWEETHPGEFFPGGDINLLNTKGEKSSDDPPPYKLAALVIAAINGSPTGRMTCQEIRLAITRRYSFFKKEGADRLKDIEGILKDHPNVFRSVFRRRTASDPGIYWEITSLPWSEETENKPITGLPPPLQPVERPNANFAYGHQVTKAYKIGPDVDPPKPEKGQLPPISTDASGLKTLPSFQGLGLPKRRRKKEWIPPLLTVDGIKTGRTGIAREALDKEMMDLGKSLNRQWLEQSEKKD